MSEEQNIEGKEEAQEPIELRPEASDEEKKEQVDPAEALKADLDEAKKKYLYLAADYENAKRRFQKEKEGLLKYGSEKILQDLVEVVDNLERTVGAIGNLEDEKVKNIVTGIDMVTKQFLTTLEKHGLSQLESMGKEFDPNFHEAMAQEESDEHSENTIISVFQRGYMLNGRLLRAAKVIVSK